jgi:hypothetical protein
MIEAQAQARWLRLAVWLSTASVLMKKMEARDDRL